MRYWAPFLHFYQPPTQFHGILKKVCNESYRPLLKMLVNHSNAKVTINICGVLTEMLNDHGAHDVIDLIRELGRRRQLEFVDSAKYHAILPLIPEDEMARQIELNHKTNSYFFKDSYAPSGFFPPEMCYSTRVGYILKKMGYKWVLLSGVACPEEWPVDFIYRLSSGLNIFYRSDILSNKISFQNIDSSGFVSELLALAEGKDDAYVITAMDAETFGHHIQNWEDLFLAQVYEMIEGVSDYSAIKQRTDLVQAHKGVLEAVGIQSVSISELMDKFSFKTSKVRPESSSWSTSKEEISKKNYYPLWNDPENEIHDLQWQHMNICFELMKEASGFLGSDKDSKRFYDIARGLLDRAIHSCQFWWANKSRGTWDMNLINKGLILQEEVILNVYRSIDNSEVGDDTKKQFYYRVVAARDIASKIRDRIMRHENE